MVIKRDWSQLPSELLDLIVPHIVSISDFIRFRSVCTTWRSAAPPQKLRPQPPVLLLPYNALSPYRSFFSLATRRVHHICLPQLQCKRILNSNRGCMLLFDVETNGLSLFNPITLAEFDLPPIHSIGEPIHGYETTLRTSFLFHDPVSDNFVVLIPGFDSVYMQRMVFCVAGDDEWSELFTELYHYEYGSIIYHKGYFYESAWDLFCAHEDRLVFSRQSKPVYFNEEEAPIFYPLGHGIDSPDDWVSEVLMGCGTVLFCDGIRKYYSCKDGSEGAFSMVKLGRASGQQVSSSIVQLKDFAIFYSASQCTMCCVKDFSQYKENCVYSTERVHEHCSEDAIRPVVGILNLKDFTSDFMPCGWENLDSFNEPSMWITLSLK